MGALVGTVVPGIVILVLTVVGVELTFRDFVRLRERRGPFLASVGGQLVLVPLLGAAIVLALAPPPAIAGVVIVLVVVVTEPAALIRESFAWIVAVAVLFTAAALGAGLGVGRLAGWPRPVSATLGLTFAARNVGIAALIAAALWQSLEFAAFGAVFFAVQFLLFVPFLARWRRMAGASPEHPA